MSAEALAFVVFSVGMLVLMGIGMNMALALLLTGAGMAWVLGYPTALLPLPALVCAAAIGMMALREIVRRTPLDLGHGAEVE